MLKFLLKVVKVAVVFFLAVMALFVMISLHINKPEVRFSYSTGECVEVLYSEHHTCENLPKRYHHVWVE